MDMQDVLSAQAPTYLDAIACEFKDRFDERISTLKKLCKSNKASSSFFVSKDGNNGFLADLIECYKQQGLSQFISKVKPELTIERELPLKDFFDVIIELPKDKLRILKDFHRNITKEKAGDGFPPEYHQIAKYFNSQNRSSNDSAEAGRLVLTLSSIGDAVIELKEVFEEYTPKTIGVIQGVLKKATTKMTNSLLLQSDQVRQTINKMLNGFKKEQLQLIELKRCVSILKVQKREFARLAIIASSILGKDNGDKIFQAQRNIETWIEWEELVKEDANAAGQIQNPTFAKCLSSFKNELNDYVDNLQNWSKRVQQSINAKDAISPLFIDLLSNVDTLITKAFFNKTHVEPSMRINLKKLQASIQGMKASFRPNLNKTEQAMKSLPRPIAERLEYLNTEIPRVLLRSNPNEVKMMTIVINASYKNVENSLKELRLGKPSDEIKRMTEDIHNRYTSIVKNATKLIKVSPVTD